MPTINTVTLCGSTRFLDDFATANIELTKRGFACFSIAMALPRPRAPTVEELEAILNASAVPPESGLKECLDLVHLNKILRSDAVFVVGDGYIGRSTAREILWAEMHGKPTLEAALLFGKGWNEIAEAIRCGLDSAPVKTKARKVLGLSDAIALLATLDAEREARAGRATFDMPSDPRASVQCKYCGVVGGHNAVCRTQAETGTGRIHNEKPQVAERNAADVLSEMAQTFRERQKVYGSNYKLVGAAMAAFFPDGVTLRTAEDWNRWHLFELVMVKLSRFAVSMLTHTDSIHDAAVYAAMVESLTNETPIKKGTES